MTATGCTSKWRASQWARRVGATVMRYGFIGLGNLGAPLAASLLRSGFAVTVHDLDRRAADPLLAAGAGWTSEEQTSELKALMRISYAVFCLKKKKKTTYPT